MVFDCDGWQVMLAGSQSKPVAQSALVPQFARQAPEPGSQRYGEQGLVVPVEGSVEPERSAVHVPFAGMHFFDAVSQTLFVVQSAFELQLVRQSLPIELQT